MGGHVGLAILLIVQFASQSGDAIPHGVLGIFAREEHGGSKQRANIVELYDELRPSLYRYLICLGMTPQEADDVIQEAFLSLFQHLEANGKDDNVRGWIFRVAHNLSRNLQKRERRYISNTPIDGELPVVEPTDSTLNPEDVYLWKEYLQRLDAAIAQLTEQQRQCVNLRAEGLRYREIASVLGISVSRVPQLLQRAIVRIMEGLDG